MAYQWPFKDPDETLDYSIDWSRYLGDATLTTVVWSVRTPVYTTNTDLAAGEDLTTASSGATTDSIQNVSQTNTNTVATINIAGGVANREYTFTCTATDNTGTVTQRSVKLRVKER